MRARGSVSWTWQAPRDWGGRTMRYAIDGHCINAELTVLDDIIPTNDLLERFD